MKRIKKYGTLVALFVFSIYDKCFADVIDPWESAKCHGAWKDENWNCVEETPESPLKYIILGWIVIVIIICIIAIIRDKKKKKEIEKRNSNN